MNLFIFSIIGLVLLIIAGLNRILFSKEKGRAHRLAFGSGIISLILFLLLLFSTVRTFYSVPEKYAEGQSNDKLHWPVKPIPPENSIAHLRYDRLLFHFLVLDADLSTGKYLDAFECKLDKENLVVEKKFQIKHQDVVHHFNFVLTVLEQNLEVDFPIVDVNMNYEVRTNKNRSKTNVTKKKTIRFDALDSKHLRSATFPKLDFAYLKKHRPMFSLLSTHIDRGIKIHLHFKPVVKGTNLKEVQLTELTNHYDLTKPDFILTHEEELVGYYSKHFNTVLIRLFAHCGGSALFLFSLSILIPTLFKRKGLVVITTSVLLILFVGGAEKANFEFKREILNSADSSLDEKIFALEFLETCLFYNEEAYKLALLVRETDRHNKLLTTKAHFVSEMIYKNNFVPE